MDICVNIRLLPTSYMQLIVQIDTTIQDLMEFTQSTFDQKFGENGWSCYSEQRGCYLNSNQEVGNYPNDTLLFSNTVYQSSQQSSYISLIDSTQFYTSQILNLEDLNNTQEITINVEILSQRLVLILDYKCTIQEIFDAVTWNQNTESHEFLCYSQKRNCYISFDEIIGYYPDDNLIFINQQNLQSSFIIQKDSFYKLFIQQIYVKVDQGDLVEMEITNYTKIKDLLYSIKNKQQIQENYDRWTCYSEIRKCYLNMDQEFGNYPNDKLHIATQKQVKCYGFSKWLEQMKKQINDRFKQIKESFIEDLNLKEKEMTDLLLKDYRDIFQLAFSPDTQENTVKLNEFILRKNQDNIQIQQNIQQLQDISSKWRVELNQIGCEKRNFNWEVCLEIEKSTTGIELLQYLEEYFMDQKNKNKTGIDLECYSLKYQKKIDLQSELEKEVKNDDIIIIGPFQANMISSGKNELVMRVRRLK